MRSIILTKKKKKKKKKRKKIKLLIMIGVNMALRGDERRAGAPRGQAHRPGEGEGMSFSGNLREELARIDAETEFYDAISKIMED